MRTIAILPIKSLGAAKQRLSELLASGSRQALAQAMFSDVLAALRHVQGIEEIVVITANRVAEDAAHDNGGAACCTTPTRRASPPPRGSASVTRSPRATSACCSCPATPRCSTRCELDAMLVRASGTAVTIVPDRHGTGTNCLLLAPPDGYRAQLRPRQPRAPRGRRPRRGGRADVVELPSLVLDVDTPDDLERAGGRSRGAARRMRRMTRGALRQLDRCAACTRSALVRLTDRSAHRRAARGAARRRPRRADRDGLAADLGPADVLVVAHKVVSKAEGRVRRLAEVEPGERARRIGRDQGKDPRLVQAVLDESVALCASHRGVLICETRHGFVCANAGVDRSNAADAGRGGAAARRTPTRRRGPCAPAICRAGRRW